MPGIINNSQMKKGWVEVRTLRLLEGQAPASSWTLALYLLSNVKELFSSYIPCRRVGESALQIGSTSKTNSIVENFMKLSLHFLG